jgi:hypothetical protein
MAGSDLLEAMTFKARAMEFLPWDRSDEVDALKVRCSSSKPAVRRGARTVGAISEARRRFHL